jgi:two-component system alkaline phosphatase synthesis response regulator PhoP
MKQIICIDDEIVALETLMLICETSGYQARGFTSPIEGLDYIQHHYSSIGLIFLDLMMPEIYGLNVLKKIRANKDTRSIPVIINSCLSDPEEINKVNKFKNTEYINKPFSTYDIINLLKKHLTL